MMHHALEVVRCTAAVLATERGDDRPSDEVINALHLVRRVNPAVVGYAHAIHLRTVRTVGSPRDAIIATMVKALDGVMTATEMRAALDRMMAYAPDAFCRHCRRPLVSIDGVLHDDASRDRTVCFRALNYTHARASESDLPAMGVTTTTEETADAPS